MKFAIRTLIFVATVAGTSSCGGNGGQPLTATSAATVLGQLSTAVIGNMPKSNAAPTLPMAGATTSSVIRTSAISCETVSPTPLVDVDADGIAASKVSTFDCSDLTSGGDLLTRKGSFTVADVDDTVAGLAAGLRVDFAMSKYRSETVATGVVQDFSYNGFWKFTPSSTGLESSADFTGSWYYSSPTIPVVVDFEYQYTWDWAITPDSIGTPFGTGAQEFSGSFRFEGKFYEEGHGGALKQRSGIWNVKYYSQDLLYDTACTKWFKSGSYFVNDGNGSSFEVRYACSTAKLYVNGVESDWWTP